MSATASYVLETLVMLAAVLAVAVGVLVGARRLGVGAPSGPLELLGRLPLDARRAIYLVRVGPQVLVVGASEGGLVKLSELSHEALPPPPAPPAPGGFATVLARARGAGARPSGAAAGSASAGGEAGGASAGGGASARGGAVGAT